MSNGAFGGIYPTLIEMVNKNKILPGEGGGREYLERRVE